MCAVVCSSRFADAIIISSSQQSQSQMAIQMPSRIATTSYQPAKLYTIYITRQTILYIHILYFILLVPRANGGNDDGEGEEKEGLAA
jgi:hypothetical protein